MMLKVSICLILLSMAVISAQTIFSRVGPRCRIGCPSGQQPDRLCRCRETSSSPCDEIVCRPGTRCVDRYYPAVCVPSYAPLPEISFPGFPSQPSNRACHLPSEPGICRAYFPRYFYNSNSGRCEEFIYGGCGRNANNFQTLRECRTTCSGRVSRRTRY